MELHSTIEQFILNDLLQGQRTNPIDPQERLVSTGVIDSLGLLRLIDFLERELGFSIGDGEVVTENFETLESILQFVQRKTAQMN